MIIDIHGHVTAPDKLYVYKANILSHRGAHGRGSPDATDDDIREALNAPVFGGSSHAALGAPAVRRSPRRKRSK